MANFNTAEAGGGLLGDFELEIDKNGTDSDNDLDIDFTDKVDADQDNDLDVDNKDIDSLVEKVDCVATEPYFGPFFKKIPKYEEVAEIIKNLEKVYYLNFVTDKDKDSGKLRHCYPLPLLKAILMETDNPASPLLVEGVLGVNLDSIKINSGGYEDIRDFIDFSISQIRHSEQVVCLSFLAELTRLLWAVRFCEKVLGLRGEVQVVICLWYMH